MKKLLYIAVTVLSLGVIFAAGWASGVGTVRGQEQPAAVRSYEITDDNEVLHDCPECPEEEPECPDGEDCPKHRERRNFEFNEHGFRLRVPFPHKRPN